MIKKKIKLISLVLILFIFFAQTVVFGANLNIKIETNKGEITKQQEIEISFVLDNYVDVNKGINAYKATLEYDKNIFEEVKQSDFTVQNFWKEFLYNPVTGEMIAINKVGSKETESIVKVKLKAKDTIQVGSTNITIKDVVVSEGKEDVRVPSSTATIQIVTQQGSLPDEPEDNKQDNNLAPDKLPQTGLNPVNSFIGIAILGLSILAITFKVKEKRLDKKLKIFVTIMVIGVISVSLVSTIYAVGNKGELSKDDRIDYLDVTLLEQHLIHLKQLSDDVLANADMNYDHKITVTDLAVLVQKIEKSLEYTVNITTYLDNYYPNKNEEFDFYFTADVSYDAEVTHITINNVDYLVSKNPDASYVVKLKASNQVGIQELKISKVKLNVGKEVKVNHIEKIDVKKQLPRLENYFVEEDISNSQLEISFDIIDPDASLINSKLEIVDEGGNTIKTSAIVSGNNRIKVPVKEQELYHCNIALSYNLDTDTLTEHEQDNIGSLIETHDLKLVIDYQLEVGNVSTQNKQGLQTNTFEKNEDIVLTFECSNSTKFIPQKIKVNGETYLVEMKEQRYKAIISGISQVGENQLVLEEVILSNGKKFKQNEAVTVAIKKVKPSIKECTMVENTENQTMQIAFRIEDEDKAIKSSQFILKNAEDEILFEEKITSKEVNKVVDLGTKLTSSYTLTILADYNVLTEDIKNEVIYTQTQTAKTVVKVRNSIVSKQQVEKQEDITISYTIETNKKSDITKLIINNVETPIKKIQPNVYQVTLQVGNTVGKKELILSKVLFADGETVECNEKKSIEVLKSKPTIMNYKAQDDYDNKLVKIDFEIMDTDQAFLSGTIKLVKKADGSVWKEEKITQIGQNHFEFEVVEKEEYDLQVHINWKKDEAQTITKQDMVLQKPIQMIIDYELVVNNIKTATLEGGVTNYFERNCAIKLLFDSNNSTKFYPQRAVIDGKEYTLTKKNNTYEVELETQATSGIQEITIEKLILDNTKEIEMTENNKIKVEILKQVPTIQTFSYLNEKDNIVQLDFEIVDAEQSLKQAKLVVNDAVEQIYTKEGLQVGKNTVEFVMTLKEEYTISIYADYDLDTNALGEGSNEYQNVEIEKQQIHIGQELIEFKDIESMTVYAKNGGQIEEVEKILVDTFQPEDYFVKLNMKKLPSFYAEIQKGIIQDGEFFLILKQDNVVQYEGNNKTNTIKVRFGKVIDNVATDITLEKLIQQISEDPTGEFTLTRNLDASKFTTSEMAIIMTDFKGKLNGNGYTISNLTKPLFNKVTSGTIENLMIEQATISGNSKGILINDTDHATISNVHITNSKITTGHANGTGSFVGNAQNGTKIEKCSANHVTVNGSKRVGGFAGYLTKGSMIDNCYIKGTIIGSNDAIGGLVGQDSGEAITIQNSYTDIQFNMATGRASGGILGYSGGNNVILKNNISLAVGEKGNRVIGTKNNNQSSNNYEIETEASKLASDANKPGIATKTKTDIDEPFLKSVMKWDDSIWRMDGANADNMPTLKNADPTDKENFQENEVSAKEGLYIPDLARLKKMANYDETSEMAYHNMNVLIPFYDAKFIVGYGNTIAKNDLLNTSKIKAVIPYDANGNIVVGLNTNTVDVIAKIRLVFENNQTKDYAVKFKKQLNNIATYIIPTLDISYTYNKYVLNTNIDLIDEIVELAEKLEYTDISSVTPEEESRLYVDYYNESVKPKLRKIIEEILENEPEYNIYLNNNLLKEKIKQDITQNQQLEKLLYTYNYYDKWYHMDIGGSPLTNIIFFNASTMMSDNYTIKTLTENTIKQGSNARGTNNTVTFYNNVIKPYADNKTMTECLEYFMKVLEGYDNPDDWFAAHFKGELCEKPAKGLENSIRYRAWSILKARNNNILLPILSAPQEDMYIISVPSQAVIGSMNRYTAHLNGKTQEMRELIENYATMIGHFYGTSATFIEDAEKILNSHAHIQYDTRFHFPKTENQIGGKQDKGKTQDPVIKWVYEAMGTFAIENESGAAYASQNDVYWVSYAALGGDYSFKIFTHETAHNQDGYYFYEGNGRRANTGYEDHADGNIAQELGDGSFVFNLRNNAAVTSDMSNNLTLDRIAGKDKIHSYYKEMFETYYVLDYLTAQAFLQLTPKEQSALAVKVTYPNASDQEIGGDKTQYVRLTQEEFEKMNLQTMEDLWNYKIAFRGTGSIGTNSYRGDNHYSIYWYQPHNDAGRPDSYSFKRLGFEMLGVAGYSDGYVTYRSKKSSNDLDAIRKITGNDTMTWKQYKLERYQAVEQNLAKIPYFDTNEIVEEYKKAMQKDAINGNRDNTNSLRRVLYGIVKRTTNDFTNSGIYKMNEVQEITTAEQFVEVINRNASGNYKLTQDIDFSKIKVETDTYITKTLVGRINGNGFSIKGLTKPLFNQITYAQLENIVIEKPNYTSTVQASVAIQAKNSILKNIEIKDTNISVPIVGTTQGLLQKLGKVTTTVKNNEIASVQDLLKISQDTTGLARKMKYKLVADIDVSSITTNNAIITKDFEGMIEGNGHKIYNLKLPLFENLTGKVNNLQLENMEMSNTEATNLAPLAKKATGATIENIRVDNITINGKENLSALVAISSNTTIRKVKATNIHVTGSRFYIGGLVGRATNTNVSNVVVEGTINIQATHNGGIIGAMNGGSLNQAYAKVEVLRPKNTDARNQNAGLIGCIEGGKPTITNSIATGNVAEDVYKVIANKDANNATAIKTYFQNVYEVIEKTGLSSANPEGNIGQIAQDTLKDKQFYLDILGWSQEDWDFSTIADGKLPIIK